MIGGLKQTTSRFAIAAAAGLFMGGIALTPAQAADLGGDCCADLEERVAELEATTVRKGNRKVSVRLSGHVNKAIFHWDDGVEEDIYIGDPGASESRVRIDGSATISPGRSAGFKFEAAWIVENPTSALSNCTTGAATALCSKVANFTDVTDMRVQEVWIKDDKAGKVTLGKGDMASNGSAEVDLSGTTAIMYSTGYQLSAFQFRTGVAFSGVRVSDVYSNLDGYTRRVRIRYDTPSLGGLVLSTSYSADDVVDFAARYAKEWNSVACAAAAAAAHDTDGEDSTDIWRYSASASCIHTPSGLNLTVAWSEDDDSERDGIADDTSFFFVKLGISRRWNSHGKTSIAAQWGQTSDLVVGTQGEADMYGVAFVQNIDSAALQLYLSWQHIEYDDNTGAVYEDQSLVAAGAKIVF